MIASQTYVLQHILSLYIIIPLYLIHFVEEVGIGDVVVDDDTCTESTGSDPKNYLVVVISFRYSPTFTYYLLPESVLSKIIGMAIPIPIKTIRIRMAKPVTM